MEYEEGKERVVKAMISGYPRFVFTMPVKQLMMYSARRFGTAEVTECMIFPTRTAAEDCRKFIEKRLSSLNVRIAELCITPHSRMLDHDNSCPTIYIVLFNEDARSIAKQFWQHSGEGVSSRFAEHCLRCLEIDVFLPDASLVSSRPGRSSRYGVGSHSISAYNHAIERLAVAQAGIELDRFVEERFGRNHDIQLADKIKIVLRRRIAGILGDLNSSSSNVVSRNIASLTENDVYLYPCGMSTIYNIHRVVLAVMPGLKSVQVGFPYIDTLKIQQKFGPGCLFLGHGGSADIQRLEEEILPTQRISSVFCEFPTNPLLKSTDLKRLHDLSNKHDFIMIVDETIGNFVNVATFPFCDVVVSSLTKVFSGDSNVMGGSAVLNPASPKYRRIKSALDAMYEDTVWCEDAIFLERNSRSFISRCHVINRNAEALCDYLNTHPLVEHVFFPKFTDPEVYRDYARCNKENNESIGYGGLFSLILKSDEAAVKLFDALEIYKGPSLGTNFTLACPYTILAHYYELDWAASYGVPKRLIRVSVGCEDTDVLLNIFKKALDDIHFSKSQ